MHNIGQSAMDRLQQSHYQVDIHQYEKQQQKQQVDLPKPGQFDIDILLKFIDEIDSTVRQTHEFKSIIKQYKLSTSKFSKSVENEYLNNLNQEKKNQIYRDLSRVFDNQEQAIALKDKVRQVLTYRLEEMRRNQKDTKWNLCLNMLQLILNKNKGNRDIFDLMQKKILPPDVRQLIWKTGLENKEVADEYSKRLNKARALTMSKFEIQIIKDTEQFLHEMTQPDTFDGNMVFAMKTILSYYELKQDRILTDYLYLICIPLIHVFGTSKHLLKIPSELVGYYYSLQLIVQFFDPLVDLVVKHDDDYNNQMTDLFMNSVNVLDEELAAKFQSILNLQSKEQRKMLVILIKRFVHSLGFAFLPLDVTLFIWDQIIMKVVKNRLELFIDMAIMCFCIRDFILQCKTWDQIVDVFYQKAKLIDLHQYHEYYLDVYKNVKFYVSPYDVDPQLVNRNAQFSTDPLTQIIEEQQEQDIKQFKKKWFQGKELYEDDENVDKSQQLPTKDKAIKDMQMKDALKNVDQKQKPPHTLGMVPVGSDDDDGEDIFAGMEDD